jgi:hypothetical protein
MRFPMPNYPCEFEIPNEWWAEAGMVGFSPSNSASADRSSTAAMLVPLQTILPPPRFPTAPKDWHGFERARLVSLLKGIATGVEIEPVPLLKLPQDDVWRMPYRYRMRDGFHRFYVSIAAGFECLPAVIS